MYKNNILHTDLEAEGIFNEEALQAAPGILSTINNYQTRSREILLTVDDNTEFPNEINVSENNPQVIHIIPLAPTVAHKHSEFKQMLINRGCIVEYSSPALTEATYKVNDSTYSLVMFCTDITLKADKHSTFGKLEIIIKEENTGVVSFYDNEIFDPDVKLRQKITIHPAQMHEIFEKLNKLSK
ncbi:MAG: hypothetical protein ACK4NC_00145 [Candidatus Gracilibacteria bacterium]